MWLSLMVVSGFSYRLQILLVQREEEANLTGIGGEAVEKHLEVKLNSLHPDEPSCD